MSPQTISEKILSAHIGHDVYAGDVIICPVDRVIGTDASSPMTIDYFEQMGGATLFDPAKVMFAFDHYAPAVTESTRGFHARVREFAGRFGAELHDEGSGISFQRAAELGRVLPGDVVIGADSHTVTCGALNLFAIGVGSSDLAAAMITGKIWLRVPESIKVVITGRLIAGVSAKDVALQLVREIGAEGADYQTLEFHGEGIASLSMDDRLVLCNLAVEAGAKAAIFPCDAITREYLEPRSSKLGASVGADADARYSGIVAVDLSAMTPRVALPHAPTNVVPIEQAIGTPVQMVFIGTCTGGRVNDFHDALRVLELAGRSIFPGVQLVLTPASREVADILDSDGTFARFRAMGATITATGCGACCGTSGVIPGDNVNVLSTANRNFKARMGNASANIYLASPIACAAAAAAGYIVDPRSIMTARTAN
ncbi:MAG: aconitase/3-isopropylmalate dehydratase large subunit family protein [Gemmatimonadaceae bacterium]